MRMWMEGRRRTGKYLVEEVTTEATATSLFFSQVQ
jgi:hypothetical protein